MSTKNDSTASQVWFITGASSGFGRAIVDDVLARGGKVVAAVRTPSVMEDLAKANPDRVHVVRLDVTKTDEIRSAIASARERFGRIDVLVNNAGYSMVGAVEETSDDELRSAMELMFFGAASLTREVLPEMRERRSGTIVQISSVGGFITAPGFGPYCAAKHALEALSEAMSVEVAPFGVRVLVVEPGAFRTSLFGHGFRRMPPIDAYASTVGPTRAFTSQSHGAQAGDPVKAARAIVDAVAAGSPTLRLPLGADAVSGIRDKLAAVAADVSRNEAVAVATTVDA